MDRKEIREFWQNASLFIWAATEQCKDGKTVEKLAGSLIDVGSGFQRCELVAALAMALTSIYGSMKQDDGKWN